MEQFIQAESSQDKKEENQKKKVNEPADKEDLHSADGKIYQ